MPILCMYPTLRSWLHETSALIITLSPGLEKKLHIGVEFQQFSRNTMYVRVPGKLSEVHSKVLVSSNLGDNIWFLVKLRDRFVPLYFTFWDLVPWIGEEPDFGMNFWEFSRHPNILVNPGKLLELDYCWNFMKPGSESVTYVFIE